MYSNQCKFVTKFETKEAFVNWNCPQWIFWLLFNLICPAQEIYSSGISMGKQIIVIIKNWLLLMFSCRDNPVTKLHPGEGQLLARFLILDLFWMSQCNPSFGDYSTTVKKWRVSLVQFSWLFFFHILKQCRCRFFI